MNSPVDDKSGANNDCKTNVDHSGDGDVDHSGDGDGDGTEIMLKKDEHNTTTTTTTTNKSVRVVSVSTSTSILSDESAIDNPDKAQGVSFGVECGVGGGDFDADALYHIVDYLSTMDLYALGNTNQYLSHFLFHLPQTESVFRPYGRQYLQFCRNFKHSVLDAVPAIQKEKEQRKRQEQKLKNQQNKNNKNPQKRKRGGKKLTDDEEKEAAEQHNQCNQLNRLGIFPTDEEDAILIEKTRDGYFGMDLIRPDVVAVSGDYSGIFLTPNIESFLPSVQQSTSSSTIASASTPHSTSTSTIKEIPAAVAAVAPTPTPTVVDANKEGATDPTINAATAAEATATDPATDPAVKTKTRLTAITSKEDGSGYLFGDSLQVMAVLCAKNINRKPYVYLGFASGKIYSIDSNPIQRYGAASGSKVSASNKATTTTTTTTSSSSNVEYPHVSECFYHCPNEISSLCSIDSKHVASSCVKPPRTPDDGPFATMLQEILIHWNALEDGNLQRISKIDISQQMDVSSPLSMSSSSFCCDWNTYDSTSTTQPKTFLSIGSSNQLLTTVWWDTHTINALIDNKYKNTDTDNNDKPLPPPKNMQQYMNIQLQSDELTTFSLARDITAPSSSRSLRLPRYESYWNYLQKRSTPSRNVHHFVLMKYFDSDHTQLVIGTSKGDVLKVEMNPRPEQEGDRPNLRIAYRNNTDYDHDRTLFSHGRTWFGRNKAQQVDYERHHLIYNCCRGGMVESVEVVGHNNNDNNWSSSSSSKVRWFDRNNNNNISNSTTTGSSLSSPIMVTAGGRDGKIRFWDWNTFAPLGYLNIHPGRWTAPTTTPPLSLANMEALATREAGAAAGGAQQQQQPKRLYHSPVVVTFFCKERSSLISLCRDGHVHEWNVEEVYRKYKEAKASNDETTTKGGAAAATTAVVSESKSKSRDRCCIM